MKGGGEGGNGLYGRHGLRGVVAVAWFMAGTVLGGVPTVGMEGRLEVVLPVAGVEARPVTERARVLVRVADRYPHGTATRYDLRYVGLVPGKHDLRESLVLPGGAVATNLEPIMVEVAGLLPARHDGSLVQGAGPGLPRLGGYRAMLVAAGVAWVTGLAGWWFMRRKPEVETTGVAEKRAETLEERLRPLVDRALKRELDLEGQARLERLLMGHWRRRLGWQDVPMDEALRRLRAHEEAGALVRAMEAWLHRPEGTTTVDVAALLAPYREVAAPGEDAGKDAGA